MIQKGKTVGPFVNKGDVNFFEYGRMIAEYEDGSYKILSCDYIEDTGQYLFCDTTVYPDDQWIDREAVAANSVARIEDEEDFALAVFERYGAFHCGGQEQTLNADEVMDEMDAYAEEYEFDSFPWRDGPLP